MTATEKLIDIAKIDRKLEIWINMARKEGMTDDAILASIKRVMRLLEVERKVA